MGNKTNSKSEQIGQGIGCLLLLFFAAATMVAAVVPLYMLGKALISLFQAIGLRSKITNISEDFLLDDDDKEKIQDTLSKRDTLQNKWDKLNEEGYALGLDVTADDTFSKRSYEGKRIAEAQEIIQEQLDEANRDLDDWKTTLDGRYDELKSDINQYDNARLEYSKQLWGISLWLFGAARLYVNSNKMWVSDPQQFLNWIFGDRVSGNDNIPAFSILLIFLAVLTLIPKWSFWERWFERTELQSIDSDELKGLLKSKIISHLPTVGGHIATICFLAVLVESIVGTYPALGTATWVLSGAVYVALLYQAFRVIATRRIFSIIIAGVIPVATIYQVIGIHTKRIHAAEYYAMHHTTEAVLAANANQAGSKKEVQGKTAVGRSVSPSPATEMTVAVATPMPNDSSGVQANTGAEWPASNGVLGEPSSGAETTMAVVTPVPNTKPVVVFSIPDLKRLAGHKLTNAGLYGTFQVIWASGNTILMQPPFGKTRVYASFKDSDTLLVRGTVIPINADHPLRLLSVESTPGGIIAQCAEGDSDVRSRFSKTKRYPLR